MSYLIDTYSEHKTLIATDIMPINVSGTLVSIYATNYRLDLSQVIENAIQSS